MWGGPALGQAELKMILHSSEKIPETFCSAIQEALKKGLLKEGTQITKIADYSLLITFILLLEKLTKHPGRQWTKKHEF